MRNASTAYVSGLSEAITFIAVGTLSNGYNALDKKKSGITSKLFTAIKPCMSFMMAAMPALKLTIAIASMLITINVMTNKIKL